MNHFGSTFILCFLGLTIFVRLNVEASGGLEGHLMMKMKKIAEARPGVYARRWNGAHNSTNVSHGYGHIIAKNRTVLASSTSTLTESFQCGWTSSSSAYGCIEYQNLDIEDSCGGLEWDCSGTGNTCSMVASTAYLVCAHDIAWAYDDGFSGASLYTCSNVPPTSKMKSDFYHGGSLSNDECNMDEDKFVVYEEIRCGYYGAYAVLTLEFQETGVNPISCTDSFTCSGETRSNEQFVCVVTTSSPSPSGGSSSTYSPPYTGTGSSNVRIPTTTTRKATKATGKIAGIVVGVVATFFIALVKYCCFTKKNEAVEEYEQNSTPRVTVVVQQGDNEGVNESAEMPTMPMEAKQKPSPTVTDSTATSKFCTRCGSAIVPNGMFCASCGKAASS